MPEGEARVAKGTSPELRELSVPPPDLQGSPRGRLDGSAVAKHTCVENPPETARDGDRRAPRPVNQTASLRPHAGPKLQGDGNSLLQTSPCDRVLRRLVRTLHRPWEETSNLVSGLVSLSSVGHSRKVAEPEEGTVGASDSWPFGQKHR